MFQNYKNLSHALRCSFANLYLSCMPLILHRVNKADQIGLWQIAAGEFSGAPSPVSSALKDLQQLRENQKLACLQMVSLFTVPGQEIYYDSHGKPHLLKDSRQLSFTHSGNYAAIMVSERYAGIDFELIRPKVLNIIHKFLNDDELRSLSPGREIEHAHVYWGAKESLYKVYGKQQLLFKEHLLIDPFHFEKPNGYFSARIDVSDLKKEFSMYYEIISGYMLVYILNETS